MNAEERKNILAGKGKARPAARNSSGNSQGKSGSGKGKAEKEPTFWEDVLSWVKTIVSSLLIVMVINGLLVASFVVPTGSMENEVMAGDFLFVNKFIYGGSTPQTIPFLNVPLPYFRLPGIREPEKGDVIVFIFPGMRDQVKADEFQYYLKRCVATAGDTLQVRNKDVYVNGVKQPAPEHAIFMPGISTAENLFPRGSHYTRDNWGPMRIPKKGDVIPLNDSTFVGWEVFIEREGHNAERRGDGIYVDDSLRTSYTVERDYCFGMGDNRDNSLDSRYWGFVPVEDVVGTPLIVYWSWPVSDEYHDVTFGQKLSNIRWNRIFKTIN